MKIVRIAIITAVVVCGLMVALRLSGYPAPRESHDLLRNVYTPRFGTVPPRPSTPETIARIARELQSPEGAAFVRRWLPSQGGTLWIALLVMLLAGFDLERPRHPRNVDLAALLLLGVLFFDILFFTRRWPQPHWLAVLWWVFDAIVILSVFLAARAVWRVYRPFSTDWHPPVRPRALAALAVVLLALNVTAALARDVDDSSFFVNLGAQRLRERGLLPYGDPILTGTPGAAYGPLLYVAQVPFQFMVDPVHLNPHSTPRPPLGADSEYYLPSPLAAKLCTIAFFLGGGIALFSAARVYASTHLGWALVALYAGSAAIIGMGGEEYYVGGMTYISHIGPPAVTTAAFAALHRPAAAGSLLVAATGCGFYPAFLLPAFLGHYWTRRSELVRFLTAVVIAGAALGLLVLWLSRPAGDRGLIGTILWDTFGHHSDPAGYGMSPFGFWGQRGGVRAWLKEPLLGSSGLTSPVMLLFFTFAAGCFFVARRRGARELALASAAIIICSNLVKIHATGTYVAWFYPILLLGLFLPSSPEASGRMTDSRCLNRPDRRPSSSAVAPPA